MKKIYIEVKILLLILTLTLADSASSQTGNYIKYPISEVQAKSLIQKVLTTAPVIDGHNDLFIHYINCKTCPRDLNDYRIDTINTGHTDITRLRKGGAGGVSINVFGNDKTPQSYLAAWDLLYSMESRFPADFKIVSSK